MPMRMRMRMERLLHILSSYLGPFLRILNGTHYPLSSPSVRRKGTSPKF